MEQPIFDPEIAYHPENFNNLSEEEEDDYQMHIEAGLVFSGFNDEAYEWEGEKKDWLRYEELNQEYQKDKEEFRKKREIKF